MVYNFFDKKSEGSGIDSILNEPIIRTFKRRKVVYSSFKNNIWGVDLTEMQLSSKCNNRIRFYYVSLIFLVNMIGLFF